MSAKTASAMFRTVIALLATGTALATYLDDEKPYERSEAVRLERDSPYHFERDAPRPRLPPRYSTERGWLGRSPLVGRAARVRPGPIYIIRTLNPEPGSGQQETPLESAHWQAPPLLFRTPPKTLSIAEGSNVQYVVFVDRSALPIEEPTLVDAYHGRLRKVHRWSPELYKAKS
ncbi:uncharacterized protein LOC119387307 [Rhipicephalus sanguineus]|uniref:uncharacterized protein LOC119387307 n=1 Tax=Rhipicephalus sanguineus TaxID=34632 RepID=UPI001893CE4A|nr:uncharacterized protein LOC119387307 [Rhipicephalus sanguineus]